MPPSPNSPDTTTATPTSPRTTEMRIAATSTPAAAPKISGSPASAAITSPGSIAWLSDSAAYERLRSRIHTPSGPHASPSTIVSTNARCMIPDESTAASGRGGG